MSIELVSFNQYGERFGSRNVDDEIQRALDNPEPVRVSGAQEVRHHLPSVSEVLFERKDESDSMPLFSITRTLTATSTSAVDEDISILRQDSDGLPIPEVIDHNTYHKDQIKTILGVKTPTGGTVVFHYSKSAA
jgi:hypothetical protein